MSEMFVDDEKTFNFLPLAICELKTFLQMVFHNYKAAVSVPENTFLKNVVLTYEKKSNA